VLLLCSTNITFVASLSRPTGTIAASGNLAATYSVIASKQLSV